MKSTEWSSRECSGNSLSPWVLFFVGIGGLLWVAVNVAFLLIKLVWLFLRLIVNLIRLAYLYIAPVEKPT